MTRRASYDGWALRRYWRRLPRRFPFTLDFVINSDRLDAQGRYQ